MPLHARSIAVSIAVICFFGLSFVGWISGLSPFTCCKRALVGATLSYIAASLAVKVINAILTNAMIMSRVSHGEHQVGSQEKDKSSDSAG